MSGEYVPLTDNEALEAMRQLVYTFRDLGVLSAEFVEDFESQLEEAEADGG